MKKLLVILSLLALTGAGCAKAPEVKDSINNDGSQDGTEQTDTMETPSNEEGGNSETENLGDITVETSTGEKIQIKAEPIQTGQNDDDIPVSDIYLGKAQVQLQMEVGNFFFEPKIIKAKPNYAVEIVFTKVEGIHTFVIDGTNANYDVKQDGKIIFTAPSKPGSYPFYCDIGNHREKGMEGTLIVE